MPASRRPFQKLYRVAGEMEFMTFSEFKNSINDGSIPQDTVVYCYEFSKKGKINSVPADNKAIWSE